MALLAFLETLVKSANLGCKESPELKDLRVYLDHVVNPDPWASPDPKVSTGKQEMMVETECQDFQDCPDLKELLEL
jgi:hypothetical protein